MGREEGEDRSHLLQTLADCQRRRAELDAEIAQYRDCDPEALEAMRRESATATEAANRWTDNVYNIKTWCKRKFAMEEAVIDKQFGIPGEFRLPGVMR